MSASMAAILDQQGSPSDSRGCRVSIDSRVTASQTLLYTYDARDRLTAVSATVAGGTVRTTRYGYDAQGRRSSMVAGDGTTTTYRYDRRHRLKELTQRSAAALLLFAASYTTDATGLRTGMQESDASGTSRTVAYTYDATRRLSSETIDHRDPTRDRSTSWSYDRVGNRLRQVTTSGSGAGQQTITVDSSYDANDRLTREEERRGSEPVRVTTTSYDANGNTLRREGPEGLTEYVWDDASRLSEQRTANSRTTYRYDADGLRIGQTHFPVSGTPTRTEYLVDPSTAYANVIERFVASGAASAKLSQVYAFGEGIVAQTTCAPTATSAANDCPMPSERFVLSDGFGSTRLLTDPTGAVTDRIDYDAFGNEIGREGTTNVEHLYRGEQFDPNLGWYYLRARYMDPARGRFASMDPFAGFSSDPVSLHKYLYAHADPINSIDPSGLMKLEDVMAGVNSAVSLSLGAVRSGFAISRVAGGAALRALGASVEMGVGQVLRNLLGNGAVRNGVQLVGQGGRRVLDFWLQVGNRVAILEVKYGLPRAVGPALTRLVAQIRTAASAEEAVRNGAQVVLFTFRAPSPQQMALLAEALGPAAPPFQLISTMPQLAQWVRTFFAVVP
jgi:RHS repeat-associated protein